MAILLPNLDLSGNNIISRSRRAIGIIANWFIVEGDDC